MPTQGTDQPAESEPATVSVTPQRFRLRSRAITVSAAAISAAALAVAVVFIGHDAMSSPQASSSNLPPLSTLQQEQGMMAGRPFVDPPNYLYAYRQKRSDFTVTARPTHFDLSGREVWGESYGGSFVGPTWHVRPGEDISVHLVNLLGDDTNLHFHGLHVSPSGDADNPFIRVAPDHTFDYHLKIPTDQPQGTFWYHSHIMNMAMPAGMKMAPNAPADDVEDQIFAGLAGTIIVGDDRKLLPLDLRHIQAHTLAFKDVQIDRTGHIVQNTATQQILSNLPTVRLVNGELQPVLTMRPGQTELWRLANEGADIFYRLHLAGYRFTVIAQDGQPAAQITTRSSLLLPPGKRYDVLVQAHHSHGSSWLQTLRYSNGPQGDLYPTVSLLRMRVAGKAESPLPMPAGSMPTSAPNLAYAHVARYRTVHLSENGSGTTFYINGKMFSMNKSVFSTPAKLGTVEQWTLINESGETHPFHVHTDDVQVMSIDGKPQPYIGDQDIEPVPFELNGVPGRVVIRIRFSDFTGKVMFHCHIAAHSDNGMMSFVRVVT